MKLCPVPVQPVPHHTCLWSNRLHEIKLTSLKQEIITIKIKIKNAHKLYFLFSCFYLKMLNTTSAENQSLNNQWACPPTCWTVPTRGFYPVVGWYLWHSQSCCVWLPSVGDWCKVNGLRVTEDRCFWKSLSETLCWILTKSRDYSHQAPKREWN